MEGASKAEKFEDTIYCKPCFTKGGFAQKQKNVKWVKKDNTNTAYSTKFGGGGNPCTVCTKTVYPAETVSYEKEIYHSGCFSCMDCQKELKTSGAAKFENKLLCTKCFGEGGYRAKQAKITAPSGNTGNTAYSSKFGGGGNPCTVCTKTVYSAETVSFEKQVYHSGCFKCTDCEKQMNTSQAAKYDEKLLCTKCFGEGGYRAKQAKVKASTTGTSSAAANGRFAKFGGGGVKCVRCVKTVYPAEQLSYEKNVFHSGCFTCLNCSKIMSPSGAEGKKLPDGGVDVYCKKCWMDLGLNRAKLNPTE